MPYHTPHHNSMPVAGNDPTSLARFRRFYNCNDLRSRFTICCAAYVLLCYTGMACSGPEPSASPLRLVIKLQTLPPEASHVET